MSFTATHLLEQGETILWQVKPSYKRYMRLSRIWVAGCILIATALALITFAARRASLSESIDTLIMLALMIVISIGWYFSQKWKYKHLSFVFTNKRILYPKTSFKEEYNSVAYSNIDDIKLNIADLDKKYATGTIAITERYYTASPILLFMLDHPHAVFEQLKKIIAEPDTREPIEDHSVKAKAVKLGWAKKHKVEVILMTFVSIIAGVFIAMMIKYAATPEQVVQAEVVDKRIEVNRSDDGTYYYYYLTFKFSDDSEKEIQIMNFPSSSTKTREKAYKSIHQGETGMLTYKHFDFDRFISFEKDPEYGGQKIEEYSAMTHSGYMITFICVFVAVMGGLIVFVIVITKKRNAFENWMGLRGD